MPNTHGSRLNGLQSLAVSSFKCESERLSLELMRDFGLVGDSWIGSKDNPIAPRNLVGYYAVINEARQLITSVDD